MSVLPFAVSMKLMFGRMIYGMKIKFIFLKKNEYTNMNEENFYERDDYFNNDYY